METLLLIILPPSIGIAAIVKGLKFDDDVINEVIDNELIGGIKLRIGNTILDGTVSSKLKKLKNNLLNNRN